MSRRASSTDVLAAPAAQRQARSLTVTWVATRCFIAFVLLVGAFVSFSVVVAVQSAIKDGLKSLESESRTDWAAYGGVNGTEEVELVKPLIGTSDRFDVGVALWFDAKVVHLGLDAEGKLLSQGVVEKVAPVEPRSEDASSQSSIAEDVSANAPVEEAHESEKVKLWSGTLFINQTLESQISHAKVQIHIPRALSRHLNSTHGTLRASFTILPHSLKGHGGHLQVVDSHSVHKANNSAHTGNVSQTLDEIAELSSVSAPLLLRHFTNRTEPKHYQMFVFNRTRVGIISDQAQVPRPALLERQKEMEEQREKCNRAKTAAQVVEQCQGKIRDFAAEVELLVEDTSMAPAPRHHVWAPRMLISQLGHSPSEMYQVANRRNETDDPDVDKDIDFVWKISFGSVTAKQALIDSKVGPHVMSPDNPISSMFGPVSAHVVHEMIASFAGDKRHTHAKPWRRLALYAFSHSASFLGYLLSLAYWYTRTTTAGVSIIGCYLRGAILVLPFYQAVMSPSIIEGIVGMVFAMIMMLGEALVLWTALRLQLHWRGSVPVLRQMPALKGERDSQRLEVRHIKWSLCGLTFALLCAVRYFGDSKFIVAGAGVGGNPAASGVKTTRFDFIALAVLLESIIELGELLQLAHNRRSRTYAGNMRIATYFTLSSHVAVMLHRHASLVRGWSEHRDPFWVTDIVPFLVAGVDAWQAYSLPPVSQVISEDDDVVAL